MELKLTEFCLPNGAKRKRVIEVGDHLQHAVVMIHDAGFRFEVEKLRTEEWSYDVLKEDEEGEVDVLATGLFAPSEQPRQADAEDVVASALNNLSSRLMR